MALYYLARAKYNPHAQTFSMNGENQSKIWWREYAAEIAIVAGGLVAVNLIFFAKAFRQSHIVNPEYAGELGAFVGGYVGSIFVLISVVLLFATLRSQRKSSALENFENKYFQLIKMHRDNVAEQEIEGCASGRKLFVLMLRELRCALAIIREIAEKSGQQMSNEQLLHVAYYCLFFGVGPNSSRMLKISLSDFERAFVDAIEAKLNTPELKDRIREERKLGYIPFEGHQSRLGHYYRHLYQMIRYVDQQTLDIDKYEFVKTIRAQLSTHEQALLLINSRTPLGHNWWQKNLILPYKLVKNIPQEFFDKTTELDVSALFPKGYFEWEGNNVSVHKKGESHTTKPPRDAKT
jgi:hypothetical protein